MKKTILFITLFLASILGAICQSEISESEIKDEQENVKMWISLIQKAEQNYIDMSVYPTEIQHYQIHMVGIIEQYMMKVEQAEIAYYDGKDYKSLVAEAETIISKIPQLKQMFDDYVDYTKTEKSQSYLELTRQALSEQKALPRMNFVAYTVFRGEYPTEVKKIRSPLPFMKKIIVIYSNGDKAYFTNDKLTKEELINE
jgi:hypothetical protein